jgi:hypothetical protein
VDAVSTPFTIYMVRMMRTVDLPAQVQKIVHRLNSLGGSTLSNVELLISSDICRFQWNDDSLELLIRKFLIHAMSVCGYRSRIHLEVCEKSRMKGLETFLSLVASRWVACSFVFQAYSRFEDSAKSVMQSMGYRCMEWIGGDHSGDQMGMYCRDGKQCPELVLYLLHGHFYIQCDLLMPIFERTDSPFEARESMAQLGPMKEPDVCA